MTDVAQPKAGIGAAEGAQGQKPAKSVTYFSSSVWREAVPRVSHYAKPFWGLIALSTVMTLCGAALALIAPWPVALVFDSVLGGKQNGGLFDIADPLVGHSQYALLVFAVCAVVVLALVQGTLTLLNRYVDTKLKLGMVLEMQGDLFQKCQRLSLGFHQEQRLGALMNKVNQAPESLGEIVVAGPPIIQSVLTLVGMFTIALLIDWQVALLALAIVPLLYYQLWSYSTRVLPRLRYAGQLEMEAMSIVNESLQMVRLINSFGRELHEYDRFRTQSELANKARVTVTVRQTRFSLGIDVATALGTGLVLGLGAWHVMQGQLSVGQLVVLMAYIAGVYGPLQAMTSSANTIGESLVGFNFATEVLDQEPDIVEAPDARSVEHVDGRVTFDNVSFVYKGRKRTLEDISFDAQPGQRIAIVGQTGSGKSTLASLLIRFYDPEQGRILIDGVDIRELKLDSLREQIAIVLQEPLLFSGTIGSNIHYGRLDATEDQIVAAAQAANAHDFISALPRGYDTPIGERGPQLSGGEKQRICVARAFLKDAPILILDEPTSSIDGKTESVILSALDDLMVGRTSFLIAHRLTTIRNADFILVIRAGKIEDQGTHEELLVRSQHYRDLYGMDRARALLEAATSGDQTSLLKRLTEVMAEPEEHVRGRIDRIAKDQRAADVASAADAKIVPLPKRKEPLEGVG
jgi:ABC-type multidrug transport system fused ATPase/permease subunit